MSVFSGRGFASSSREAFSSWCPFRVCRINCTVRSVRIPAWFRHVSIPRLGRPCPCMSGSRQRFYQHRFYIVGFTRRGQYKRHRGNSSGGLSVSSLRKTRIHPKKQTESTEYRGCSFCGNNFTEKTMNSVYKLILVLTDDIPR